MSRLGLAAISIMRRTPITEKHHANSQDTALRCGGTGMQGWRLTDEDAMLCLPKHFENDALEFSIFAVFDGHMSHVAAVYCRDNLVSVFKNELASKNDDVSGTLTSTFLELDRQLQQCPRKDLEKLFRERIPDEDGEVPDDFAELVGGCTVTVAVLTTDRVSSKRILYVANAGDSRAVVSCNGIAVALSRDHNPHLKDEAARIIKAQFDVCGGRVYCPSGGNMNVSRGIGDFAYRVSKLAVEDQPVTPVPEITVTELTCDHEVLILACDGVWDSAETQPSVVAAKETTPETSSEDHGNQFVVSKMLNLLRDSHATKPVVEANGVLLDELLGDTSWPMYKRTDNMTLVTVKLCDL